MPKTPKPDAIFELVFNRPGLYPWNIPIGKVMAAISAIRRLTIGEVLAEEDEEDDKDDLDKSITLLDVRRGSAVFRFAGQAPPIAVQRLRQAGKILHDPEQVDQSEYVLRPIKDLSAIARSLECSIVIKEPGKGSTVFAEVLGESYSQISKSLLLIGDTSIAGRVLRVGGATEVRCGLRVPFQTRMLFCRVESHKVARKLGDYLYQPVVVHGTAKWLKSRMRIYGFTIKEAYKPKSDSIVDSLDAIWDAGVKDWEKIENPDSYFQQIREQE